MSTNQYNRRHFIRQTGICGLAVVATASGLTILTGCNAKQEAEEVAATPHNAINAAQAVADPCNDLSSLTKGEIETRNAYDYESRSADGTELCRTCEFWQPSGSGELCGTCTLMNGPIHPLGTCNSWEEKA